MDRDGEREIIRRAYAKQIMAACGTSDRRIEAAFASVKREDFLARVPWQSCAGVVDPGGPPFARMAVFSATSPSMCGSMSNRVPPCTALCCFGRISRYRSPSRLFASQPLKVLGRCEPCQGKSARARLRSRIGRRQCARFGKTGRDRLTRFWSGRAADARGPLPRGASAARSLRCQPLGHLSTARSRRWGLGAFAGGLALRRR
jgi:hypothetical protein